VRRWPAGQRRVIQLNGHDGSFLSFLDHHTASHEYLRSGEENNGKHDYDHRSKPEQLPSFNF